MTSTQLNHPHGIKVRIFRFLQSSWTQILTGQIKVDGTKKNLKIIYENSNNDHLIPQCTPTSMQGASSKYITVDYSRLSKIQQDESDKKIIYLWIDTNPFSLSFLSEAKATEICQYFQILQENIQINNNDDQNGQSYTAYIQYSLEKNPGLLFGLINNGVDIIGIIIKAVEKNFDSNLSSQFKQGYFTVFQAILKLGDKKLIQRILENHNYEIVLKILSWSQFNRQKYNYWDQYNKLVNFNNALGITNQNVLESYQQNAKLKFLRDVAACTILDVQNERIISNIINLNNQTILYHITNSNQIKKQLVGTAKQDPKTFLNIFIELWDIFKSINTDYQNKTIKQDFVKMFIKQDLHNLAVKSATQVVTSPSLSQTVTIRFHEKWVQAFNPFLSYDWEFSQQWIISKKGDQCLVTLLYKIINDKNDQGLIVTVLNFVKWLIQPTDNRIKMTPKFTCFVYNQFIGKIWQNVKQNTTLIEIYIQFLLKIYKVDYVRTRRILIQNKILHHFDNQLVKKQMLICAIKILDNFMDGQNLDVFIYLQNHSLFKGLKQQYLRNVSCQNMISSCFRCLLKKVNNTECKEARKYFEQIFLLKQTNHHTS